MEANQQCNLVELKSLLTIIETDIDWVTFETKYKQIKLKLSEIVDEEADSKLKVLLHDKRCKIISFETKAKGLNNAKDLFDKSIKSKATKKSILEFNSKFYEVKTHILNDLNDFIDSIPNE